MKNKHLFRFFILLFGIVIGYCLGQKVTGNKSENEEYWHTLSTESSTRILKNALKYGDWREISLEDARSSLPQHLDAASIPHGDLSVSSEKVHSRRYIISQWQRVATGAIVVVLGRDSDGHLCTAIGPQRGALVHPQGYMESPLPQEDLTGLREKGFSRINASTGEAVPADKTLEDNAIREVKEEIGIDIQKNNLKLLNLTSSKDEDAVVYTVAGVYGATLDSTPSLKTLDTEFADDDMSHPFWVKISDIRCRNGLCYTPHHSLPLHPETRSNIQKAVKQLGSTSDHREAKEFLGFR